MVKDTNKHFGLRVSVPFLEEYLFKNKVRISHVQMDHNSRTIVFYFQGAGETVAEGCQMVEVREHSLANAIQYIKQCLTQD